MAGVFHSATGYHSPDQPTTATVVIDNSIKIKPVAPPDIADDTQEITETAESTEKVDEAALQRNRLIDEEIEKVKQHYRAEGEKALADARERAQKILSDTEKQAQDYAAKAKEQAEAIFEKSKADGFAKGHEDGYAAGLDKCRDMLTELKKLSEQMVSDKAELFDSYEVEIFDTVMEIVNRITLNSLGQKDKAVVRKTIKEAGKSFRGSEYVKLTLSKTDVSEEMAADTDYFKKLFTNVKNVEVEVLKDAPGGTVIIDNGSEITDAGIQTQLKMIEELGRGKYRRAPSRKKAKAQEEQTAEAVPDSDGAEQTSE